LTRCENRYVIKRDEHVRSSSKEETISIWFFCPPARPAPLTLRHGVCGYLRSECCRGGEWLAALHLKLSCCAHSTTSSTRPESQLIPFWKSSLWPDWEPNPTISMRDTRFTVVALVIILRFRDTQSVQIVGQHSRSV